MDYEVVRPIGKDLSEAGSPARRLDTLNGKTVCEIWNAGFLSDVTFPIIEKLLRQRYPEVKIVPYTKFPGVPVPSMQPSTKEATLKAVRAALIENGCDALIAGNGG